MIDGTRNGHAKALEQLEQFLAGAGQALPIAGS